MVGTKMKFLKISAVFLMLGIIISCFFIFFSNDKTAAPKKIMFIAHTETINGKGVLDFYKLFKKRGHEVKVVAIPLLMQNNEILYDVEPEFFEKFESQDVVFPCGKQRPYTTCKDYMDFKPDITFVQNPYNSFKGSILDPIYTLETLKVKSKKVAYVVYGPHLFHQTFCNNPTLPTLIDYVFVDSESTKSLFVNDYKFKQENVVVAGYQNYKNVRELKRNYEKRVPSQYKQTILWIPRWTLHFRNRDFHESGSTFLSYERFFYNYAKTHSDRFFIIRPHALLFSFALKNKFLTEDEIKEIKARYASLPNVRFSEHTKEPLEYDVLDADLVVSDGTSALGEVVVADKPIIYTSNGWNNEFESNALAKQLKKIIYFAHDPLDIETHIETIINTGLCPHVNRDDKPTQETWKHFKKDLDPVSDPAKYIVEFIERN